MSGAVFDEACAAKGIRVDIALQASAPGTVADLAYRGLGIAILSESMAATHSVRLKALVIGDVDVLAVLALIWSSAPSPALKGLLPHLQRSFTGRRPPRFGRPRRRATRNARLRRKWTDDVGDARQAWHRSPARLGVLRSRRPGPPGAKGPLAVGAVVTDGEEIVARGHNQMFHAGPGPISATYMAHARNERARPTAGAAGRARLLDLLHVRTVLHVYERAPVLSGGPGVLCVV